MTKYIEQLMSEHPDACAAILKAAKSSGFLSDVEVLLKLPDLTDQTFNAKREELKGAGEGTDLLLQELVMPNIDKDFFIDTPANDEDFHAHGGRVTRGCVASVWLLPPCSVYHCRGLEDE